MNLLYAVPKASRYVLFTFLYEIHLGRSHEQIRCASSYVELDCYKYWYIQYPVIYLILCLLYGIPNQKIICHAKYAYICFFKELSGLTKECYALRRGEGVVAGHRLPAEIVPPLLTRRPGQEASPHAAALLRQQQRLLPRHRPATHLHGQPVRAWQKLELHSSPPPSPPTMGE